MTKVKICGITSAACAVSAINAGADALGFIFAKSPRQVNIEKASKIIQRIPPMIPTIGVFVNASKKDVLNAIKKCCFNAIQLHGEEDDNYCNYFKKYCKIIKAIRVSDKKSISIINKYKNVDAFLFDAFSKSMYGGTGKTLPLEIVSDLKMSKPYIIAGGINSKNVLGIIKKCRPYAVDVSSGVEETPGKKSKSKIIDLINVVRKIK